MKLILRYLGQYSGSIVLVMFIMVVVAIVNRQLNVAANCRAVENAHNISYPQPWPGRGPSYRNAASLIVWIVDHLQI